jgi:hypothetical protein
MARLGILLLAFFLVQLQSYAQFSAPKYSNEFLAIGVGARALGMGQTQVSLADDATAGYWNPAGLASMTTKFDASLMHAQYFGGVADYDFAAFAATTTFCHKFLPRISL